MRMAIFAAMPWECRPVLRHLPRVRRERVGSFTVWRAQHAGGDVAVIKTGIGPENADAAASMLLARGDFDIVLSTGCAGGLRAGAMPGDVVVASRAVCAASGRQFVAQPAWMAAIEASAAGAGLKVTCGPMLCVDHALTTVAGKRLAAADGHVAVEMEGAAIAACAARTGIPYGAVRSILDGADTDLGEDGSFIDPHSGAVQPLAIAKYIATRRTAIPHLLAMQRMMHAAQTSLDRFFAVWFRSLPLHRRSDG